MKNCPILPQKNIKRCLIGAKYINEINDLEALDIKCIGLAPVSALDSEIDSHADILCLNLGNGNLLAESKTAGELDAVLSDYNIIKCNDIKSPYPDDVKLNAALIGDRIICNTNFVSVEIKDFCNKNNIKIIHTNQGYTKCSLCVVTENAVITEDDGLASLLKKYQFDVLKIKAGYVYLSDKHYGFIGGASGKVSEKQMYFSGDLSAHPDYKEIISFLNNYHIEAIYNKKRCLNDFGSFIAL